MKLIGLSSILILFFGGSIIWWLNNNCHSPSKMECLILWGAAFASVLGGVLFTEYLLLKKKAREEWYVQKQNLKTKPPEFSGSQILFISISWMTLSAILTSLPLVAGGSIAIAIFGAGLGFCIDFLVRGIMGWMPPLQG